MLRHAAAMAAFSLLACRAADAPASAPRSIDAARADTSFADGGRVRLDSATVARLVAEDPLWATALRLHYDALVLDGHIDTPTLMLDEGYAFGERHAPQPGRAHVDLPRMAEGGLDAAFFSIYVSRDYGETPAATARAHAMIAETVRQIEALPGAGLARTADDVRRLATAGRAAILMGLEGGHALQASPAVLDALADAGIRYVTLTHTNTNGFADAATDTARWGGLNDTGRALVRHMNRRGVVVDLSHVSEATVFDALAVSTAPAILSHSSCAAVHAHPRNASDDVLRAVAARGGVTMIAFYPPFLGPGATTLETVLDHLDHAIRVAGPDGVGLGSDFDGVDALPDGLADATRLPWLTYGMLRRGHSEATVRKVLGLNVLRVLDAVEAVAAAEDRS